MYVSIILPTFNEKSNIVNLIKEIISVLNKDYSYEVIVVDDNSPDGTAKACKKNFSGNKNIKVFVRTKDRGLAKSIAFGIKNAKGKYVIVMDTDFNHDPKKILLMLSKVEGKNMVIGSRYTSGGGMENKKRYWLSNFYNFYLRLILGIPVADFLSGFFCINRLYINKFINKNIFNGYGEYFMSLIYFINKAGGSFVEVPVFYKNRIHGESKSSFLTMFLTYTKTSIGLLMKGK